MSSVRLAALAVLVGCSSLWSEGALAQVYRIVGPDGRVTFSDRPPAEGSAQPARTLPLSPGGDTVLASLPAELRAAASRFPVVLYTGVDCVPCLAARSFLTRRGVPFTERTVTTEADIAALQKMAGVARVPFATIGGQHIRGFSEAEWSQYLDAAGYPQVSQLPAGYRNPAPTPLVALQSEPQPEPPAAQQAAPRAEVPQPTGPTPENPAGIRF